LGYGLVGSPTLHNGNKELEILRLIFRLKKANVLGLGGQRTEGGKEERGSVHLRPKRKKGREGRKRGASSRAAA